ncbi:MAG: hypothetical protein ACE5JS_21595 [Nitrospinota bacterium]
MAYEAYLIAMVRELATRKFYGELLIKFEHGRIILLKKTESILLSAEERKK